jgi:predicted permease
MDIQGRPHANEDAATVQRVSVAPGYFETLRQPLLAGRTFTDHDDDDAKSPLVGIINQTLARHRWPNEDPVGQRVSFDKGNQWVQIVGVVGDVREYGLNKPPEDEVYQPFYQRGAGPRLVVRTAGDPFAVQSMVASAIRSVDPQIAIDQVNSITRLVEDSTASPRITTILLAIFAGLALVISATGIAGLMALAVSQRTHELGIRMALGQTRTSLMQMLLQQGLLLAVSGTALGILGALGLGRLLSSLLYKTSTRDVFTFATVSLVFLAVAATSCMLPARRVTTIDPSRALRQE